MRELAQVSRAMTKKYVVDSQGQVYERTFNKYGAFSGLRRLNLTPQEQEQVNDALKRRTAR